MPLLTNNNSKPWPQRAVVTAGMPYGNKALHFGHVGGVFVPADCFARFLKDRIGSENVRFVSGTDCYGSPIMEGYRKLVDAGQFSGSISDYVRENHNAQARTLKAYQVDLSIYEGSSLDHAGEVHARVSKEFITKLFDGGWLKKTSTLQFYDTQANTFLNGRQVTGFCPVQGCKSEKAYADECDLGHQFEPQDLLKPVSSLTSTTPEMRPVENWYFDLPAFAQFLRAYAAELEANPHVRPLVAQTMREFLGAPVTYIKNELYDAYASIVDTLPPHEYRPAQKGKQSFELEFSCIEDRDAARSVLSGAGIRFRMGKTLVPFRMTGNIEWGVAAPVLDNTEHLTVWCWPESLWAPISFTQACNDKAGLPHESWRDFWCSEDAQVYQFIGQDNLYFYGVVQPALFEALRPGNFEDENAAPVRQTHLIANHHVLFGKTKASSSGAVKPPSADELLDYYTPEQLRAHWLALGLDQKSVGFSPKPFDPDPQKRNDTRYADPVLKEGALLTNVFNRLARSVFYEAQKTFGGMLPVGAVSPSVVATAHDALIHYDDLMHKVELHSVVSVSDAFIRYAQKYWADGIRELGQDATTPARRQLLCDSAYALWVSTVMMHPIVPVGCEKICEQLLFEQTRFFSWNTNFNTLEELCSEQECAEQSHAINELPPRFDFFKKHPSQFK